MSKDCPMLSWLFTCHESCLENCHSRELPPLSPEACSSVISPACYIGLLQADSWNGPFLRPAFDNSEPWSALSLGLLEPLTCFLIETLPVSVPPPCLHRKNTLLDVCNLFNSSSVYITINLTFAHVADVAYSWSCLRFLYNLLLDKHRLHFIFASWAMRGSIIFSLLGLRKGYLNMALLHVTSFKLKAIGRPQSQSL